MSNQFECVSSTTSRKTHFVASEYMYQNGKGPVGFRLTLCGLSIELGKVRAPNEKHIQCAKCEDVATRATKILERAQELEGTNHGKWIKGQPAYGEFPPGSIVACGGKTGTVVLSTGPTKTELESFTILYEDWHRRVPVKWDETGNVTWCRVDDKILAHVQTAQ